MTEIETIKIKALHERLVAAQHTLIIQASNSATLPSDCASACKILDANLECAP